MLGPLGRERNRGSTCGQLGPPDEQPDPGPRGPMRGRLVPRDKQPDPRPGGSTRGRLEPWDEQPVSGVAPWRHRGVGSQVGRGPRGVTRQHPTGVRLPQASCVALGGTGALAPGSSVAPGARLAGLHRERSSREPRVALGGAMHQHPAGTRLPRSSCGCQGSGAAPRTWPPRATRSTLLPRGPLVATQRDACTLLGATLAPGGPRHR